MTPPAQTAQPSSSGSFPPRPPSSQTHHQKSRLTSSNYKIPSPCNLLAKLKVPPASLSAQKILEAAKMRGRSSSNAAGAEILDETAVQPVAPAVQSEAIPKDKVSSWGFV